MSDQEKRLRPRRAGGLIAAAAIAAFAVTAVGLTAGIRAADSRGAQPGAEPVAAAAHAHSAPAEAAAAEVSAPKNTMSADAPAYRPAAVQSVHLDMTEKTVEIAPGKVVKVWTFGNRVPGPVIRVRVGDLVRVTITNRTKMPHSIDLHAARVAPNVAFRDVAAGEGLSFEFTATTPGVFMYHCGTAPVLHHIANGMYGMIIVEPEGGLPPVGRELAIVQSEFYVSDTPGMPADDAKLMTGVPDVVAFNGYAGQYKDDPIVVKWGVEILVFPLAAGPNTCFAFHVAGTNFYRAYIDGIHPEYLSTRHLTNNPSATLSSVTNLLLE